MRISSDLLPSEFPPLSEEDMQSVLRKLVGDQGWKRLQDEYEVDASYEIQDVARFRLNAFKERGRFGAALRVIPLITPTLDGMGLPAVIKDICQAPQGLVLVTGPTGSGKSTTLAAMITHINDTQPLHIVTIEDPIEFLHEDDKSSVSQREIGIDTTTFADALRAALRQDPDVILVGEMRDFETIETGLLAAETGHLVFSTLHTLDATETVNRIIAVFPPHQQKQIRLQLASVLKAVISQRLMPRADGRGRAPAVEVLISTAFIRDCIVDKDNTHQIAGAIAAGTSQYGMQTFDQSIFGLFEQGLVSYEEALRWASNVNEFKLKVQGIGTTSDMSRDQMAKTVVGAPEITRFGS
jgi:twitching motility protein PilT